MVVCPWCGKSSNSTTYCVSCGAKLNADSAGAEPENQTPAFASFVTAINSKWPDLQMDGTTGPMGQMSSQPPYEAAAEPPDQEVSSEPGHVLVRLKPSETGSSGDLDEYIVELSGQDVIVGRLPTCEICLDDDPLVSRYHANLSFRDGVYVLADMGSSNGTYLNDAAVTEDTIVQIGDEITVGIHEILVRGGHDFPEYLRRNARHPEKVTPPALPDENTDPGLPASEVGVIENSFAGSSTSSPLPLSTPDSQPVSAPVVAALPQTPPLDNLLGLHQHDFGALQSQLEDIARVLGRQAAEDARVATQLRTSLESARATLANLLATELEPLMELFSPDLGEMIQTARQAAENPRHVDYVTALAGRADTIATTLSALQRMQSQTGILANLRALYAELDAALE